MTNREKVIKGLEYCEKYLGCCDKCPYWNSGVYCTDTLAHDALSLLKGQDKLIELLERQLELITKLKTNADAFDWERS